MKVALTGGTGLVGRAFAQDPGVTLLGRDRPYRLGDRPDLAGVDLLIHCAFSHVPGRYRGGEGDDAAGFIRDNLDGTVALFEAAKAAGVPRVMFLSSRAVYGDYPPGTPLSEDLPPRPDTLYGQVKWQAEQALAALCGPGFSGLSLRATGIYGATGPNHKWAQLFKDFAAARPIAPRAGTELHSDDLRAATHLLRDAPPGAYNLSDITLDRHDLLAEVARLTGIKTPLPARSTDPVSAMTTTRARALGWRPGGMDKLRATLPALL